MSKISEPRTPSPYERLKLVEELMENGVPVVIRYQPFILGVSDSEESLTRLFSEFERVGVSHLIIESLRLPSNDLNFIRKLLIKEKYIVQCPIRKLGIKDESFFLRPNILWRANTYKMIKELCDKYGIKFAICKEGPYSLWITNDYCGFYLLNSEKVKYRLTLREFWKLSSGLRLSPSYNEVIEKLDPKKYLCSANINLYPKIIRVGVKYHERRLLKVISDKNLVK